MNPEHARLSVVRTALRVLSFRATRDELARLGNRDLAFGLGWTWLVGVGRYWDNPRANLLQHLGLGSVAYVFVLSAVLWLAVRPLRPNSWSYRGLLTFVCLTSPPAALYAIPVEQHMDLASARTANAWFLAVVAAWRLGLFFWYVSRLGALRWYATTVAVLLPMTCVVVALTALNLEHVTFRIMGGLDQTSPHTAAFMVMVGLSLLSMYAIVPLLIAYSVLVIRGSARRPTP